MVAPTRILPLVRELTLIEWTLSIESLTGGGGVVNRGVVGGGGADGDDIVVTVIDALVTADEVLVLVTTATTEGLFVPGADVLSDSATVADDTAVLDSEDLKEAFK